MFALKRKIPTYALYYLTRAVGTQKMKNNMKQLKQEVDKGEDIATTF